MGTDVSTNLANDCCSGKVEVSGGPPTCSMVNNKQSKCQSARRAASAKIFAPNIDPYNLYTVCVNKQSDLTRSVARSNFNVSSTRSFHDRKMMLKNLGLDGHVPSVDVVPCHDLDQHVAIWINQPHVKKALHVSPKSARWQQCSDKVSDHYTTQYVDMSPQVHQLVRANIYGLLYNGDVDMMCNYQGNEWFADALGFKVISDYKQWHYERQLAGFVKHYNGLTFATVKGSGHMVPMDKPGQALKLFTKFLNNFGRRD